MQCREYGRVCKVEDSHLRVSEAEQKTVTDVKAVNAIHLRLLPIC